jgi:hypothetical protein
MEAPVRIISSDVSLASSWISIAQSTVKEHLRQWDRTGEVTIDTEEKSSSLSAASSLRRDVRDMVQLSNRAAPQPPLPRLPLPDTRQPSTERNDLLDEIKDEVFGDLKARIMKDIIEAFIGKEIDVFSADDLNAGWSDNGEPIADPASAADAPDAQTQLEGWGVDYQYRESHYTKEGMAFTAAGTATTADGRTIDFSASLEMSRETYDEINLSLKAGDALKDPLMIDLSGAGISFSDVKFAFDIDANGVDDMINAPRSGSGFLAYDRNGNGLIDDGTELFGPQSGNGFSELALLDSDSNGWIDEGDNAFGAMKVWQKDASGTDRITSLLQSNVGAIYTGKAATPYNLTDGSGSLAGVLRESGVFLKQNGGAGVVQEVDLVV